MISDTSPNAAAIQQAVIRGLGVEARLRAAVRMSEDAARIALEGERIRHPECSDAARRLLLLQRRLGSDLALALRLKEALAE